LRGGSYYEKDFNCFSETEGTFAKPQKIVNYNFLCKGKLVQKYSTKKLSRSQIRENEERRKNGRTTGMPNNSEVMQQKLSVAGNNTQRMR
jgi:hypothetical protein